jgi:NTE family protein
MVNATARTPSCRINLALQGGGAHGAYAWGVLDRLLAEPEIDLGVVSATSAGAFNAVAMLSGLLEGGRPGAQRKLGDMWQAVHRASAPDYLKYNPFMIGFSTMDALSGGQLSGLSSRMSPYAFNPLDLNPLRTLLAEHIDFERLRTEPGPDLLIAATNVANGQAHFFRRTEISVDVVLASACLPTLHRAVRIGDAHFWDGGFSANPDLVTLAGESEIADTLVVLLNPMRREEVPMQAREIAGHISTIAFNQPFLRDVAMIEAIRAARPGVLGFLAPARQRRILAHRFHVIDGSPHTIPLATGSQLTPDWDMLVHLHDAGWRDTTAWIVDNAREIGKQSTVDLAERYLPRTPIPNLDPLLG